MSDELERMNQSKTAKAKTLADWRASRLHELVLPSGLDAIIRDVTMTDLMLTGKLPASFIEMADGAAKKGEQGLDLKALAQNGTDFKIMLDALCTISLVSPQIGPTANETFITLDELPNDDKMFIFNFVNREVEQIKSFRDGQNEPVAVV